MHANECGKRERVIRTTPFGLLILGTLFGAFLGSLVGPCCGAWREIARAEITLVFAF